MATVLTWFRLREPWQQGVVLSAVLALAWLIIYRLPAFISGGRPVTLGEVDGDLAGLLGIFLFGLWLWGVHRAWTTISPFAATFVGLYVAAEALGALLDFLLGLALRPLRSGRRR